MKNFIGLLLLVIAYYSSAQEYVLIKGQTRDSTLAVIPFANVLAIDTTTNEMESFAVTGVDGNFQLRLRSGKAYELKVTYVGFVPYQEYIKLDATPEEPFIIILKESVNKLDEVTVVADMPVLVRGDTISYKAEAFTDGDERKLGDIIEDLPGFEIDDNGEIQVQGQRVEKVLVDGKEFFEGDTKLATQNIPADVVDRIQLLQNYNDIAPLQGIGNDDRLALNIELKEDKKRIVFGDVEVGGGFRSRYLGHANAFYYAPKTSLNFIGDANNIGQLALTINDYFRMSGGLASFASRNGTSFRINAADTGIPITDRNSARSLENNLGALNFSSQPSKKLQFSGFIIGFDNDNALGSNALRTYPQLNQVTQEQLISNSTVDNQSGLARFSAKYTPNYNVQLDYSFFGKKGDIIQFQERISQIDANANQLGDNVVRAPSSQTHQLRMFSGINERNIVSAELNYEYERNQSDRELVSSTNLFSGFIDVPTESLTQNMVTKSNNFDLAFNHYYIFNTTTHFNTATGINRSNQQLFSSLNAASSSIQPIASKLNITNQFVRFSFRKKWNKLTVNPGLSLNNYQVDFNSTVTGNKQYLFPQLTADYDFGSTHSIRFNYQQSIEYTDINGYTDGLILDSYNTLLSGNNQIRPALYHSFNMNYRNFNTYNFFNIYAGISHQQITDGFTQNQALNGIENLLTSVNSNGINQISSVYSNLEKRFNNWRISGDANMSRTELNTQLENQEIENINLSQQYALNISAKLFKAWSLRASYSISINDYTSDEVSNRFLNFQPNVSTVLTLKGFRLESTYTFNQYKNQQLNQSSVFDMWDATLSYRASKSPWEFKIQGLNLLDTREVRRDSFSNNLISTFSYFIQQRYGIFTMKYDL